MIGVNLDSGASLKLETLKRLLPHLRDIGFRAIRYWAYGHNNDGSGIIKAPGYYEFANVLAALRAIRNEGFYNYTNWGWLPRSFSGGLPAYEMFASWVSDPHTSDADLMWQGPDGTRWRWCTVAEAPWLYDPNIPHVDGPMEGFGEAFASECSPYIDYIGTWNEPGDKPSPFWAAHSLTRLYDEVLRPFAVGYRRGCTGGVATFVGPDAHVDSVLDELCQIEQERSGPCEWWSRDDAWPATSGPKCGRQASDARHAPMDPRLGYPIMERHGFKGTMQVRVFDVLSWHGYSWDPANYLTAALRRSDEFMAVVRKRTNGRPGWDTESEDHEQTAELFAARSNRYGDDLRAQFAFNPASLFAAGAEGWERNEFGLSDRGKRMKAWIAGETTKRRSVAK